jgi:hypothetical protein
MIGVVTALRHHRVVSSGLLSVLITSWLALQLA